MKKEIGDYKKRLDDEMLKCMDGGITGQRMMTIKEINQCWMELDDRERRMNIPGLLPGSRCRWRIFTILYLQRQLPTAFRYPAEPL